MGFLAGADVEWRIGFQVVALLMPANSTVTEWFGRRVSVEHLSGSRVAKVFAAPRESDLTGPMLVPRWKTRGDACFLPAARCESISGEAADRQGRSGRGPDRARAHRKEGSHQGTPCHQGVSLGADGSRPRVRPQGLSEGPPGLLRNWERLGPAGLLPLTHHALSCPHWPRSVMHWLHPVGQGLARFTALRWAAAAAGAAQVSQSRTPVGASVATSDRREPRRSGATQGEPATTAGPEQLRGQPVAACTGGHAKRCVAATGSEGYPQGAMALAWRISCSWHETARLPAVTP